MAGKKAKGSSNGGDSTVEKTTTNTRAKKAAATNVSKTQIESYAVDDLASATSMRSVTANTGDEGNDLTVVEDIENQPPILNSENGADFATEAN